MGRIVYTRLVLVYPREKVEHDVRIQGQLDSVERLVESARKALRPLPAANAQSRDYWKRYLDKHGKAVA
jgi:hypothetical protein